MEKNRQYYNPSFYQQTHDNSGMYQRNNWLLADVPRILDLKKDTILEIGCGNGKFLQEVLPFHEHVYAVDWAKSPNVKDLLDLKPPNLTFFHQDLTEPVAVKADIAVSADVLEHLPPETRIDTDESQIGLVPY